MINTTAVPFYPFDSSNWDSIQAMYDKINELGFMLMGTTSEGEFITYSADEVGHNLSTRVSQRNGWTRMNIYWLDDHMREEMHIRE